MLDVKRFDYESITQDLIKSCVADVEYLYEDGFTKPREPNQTLDELFNSTMPVWDENWQLLKSTFEESIYKYLGLRFMNCKSWVFASFAQTPQTHGHAWHVHPNSRFSGIMYLTLPQDLSGEPCNTTEFMEESGRRTLLEPVIGSWFIFDSRRLHRSGYWKHHEMHSNRYCLVASVF